MPNTPFALPLHVVIDKRSGLWPSAAYSAARPRTCRLKAKRSVYCTAPLDWSPAPTRRRGRRYARRRRAAAGNLPARASGGSTVDRSGATSVSSAATQGHWTQNNVPERLLGGTASTGLGDAARGTSNAVGVATALRHLGPLLTPPLSQRRRLWIDASGQPPGSSARRQRDHHLPRRSQASALRDVAATSLKA